jgi:hypothetical protein
MNTRVLVLHCAVAGVACQHGPLRHSPRRSLSGHEHKPEQLECRRDAEKVATTKRELARSVLGSSTITLEETTSYVTLTSAQSSSVRTS